MLDSIFGTPNKDTAMAKLSQLKFSHFSNVNKAANDSTTAQKEKVYAKHNAQKFYSEKVFNAKLKIQGKVLKGKEDMARRLFTSTKVNEGGRSRRFGDNLSLMAASKISQLENMSRFVGGELASANINTGAIILRNDLAKANTKIRTVAATPGFKYTKDNNMLKAVKLAASVATGDFGGAFGTLGADGTGGNASMLQWMGNKSQTAGWLAGGQA